MNFDKENTNRRSFMGMMLAAGAVPALATLQDGGNAGATPATDVESVRIDRIGRYATGEALGGAEIVSFQAQRNRLFVVNSNAGQVEVLDLSNPSDPTQEAVIEASATAEQRGVLDAAGGTNSVDVRGSIIAVAVQADPATDDGAVAFFDANTLEFENAVRVGPLPDKVTISPDGDHVVVANEGEPGETNPTGSVSVIDISRGPLRAAESRATFEQYDGMADALRSEGVHLVGADGLAGGDGQSPAVSEVIEPEFVTISPDSDTAYVSLQENNAIATVDLEASAVTRIDGLGFKDFSLPGNELDTSDVDGISLQRWPLKGMYQPDAIDAYEIGGETFIVTANEGDAKDFEVGVLKNLELEPEAFELTENPYVDSIEELKQPTNLGNMEVNEAAMREFADEDGNEAYSEIFAIGGRSFSVWHPTSDGLQLVFDSGGQIEQIFAEQYPAGHKNVVESGPETESVDLGQVGDRTFAFVGQEVGSGIAVYDVTTPGDPDYIQMEVNRDYSVTEDDIVAAAEENPDTDNPARAGDFAPEGVHFVPATDSPIRHPLLCVGFEISGTVSVFEITPETGQN